jgi:hypothetical protein
MTNEKQEMIEQTAAIIKMVGKEFIDNMAEPFALGHAFVWCTFKVGDTRCKVLIGSGCAGNWNNIQSAIENDMKRYDVSTWINLD